MVMDNSEDAMDDGGGGIVVTVGLDDTGHGRHGWWEFVLMMRMGTTMEGVFSSINGGR